MTRTVICGKQALSIDDVVDIAHQRANIALSDDADFLESIRLGPEFLDRLLAEEGVIYGVTTGYGDSCTVDIPLDLVDELPLHLTRFHGCGMGEVFSPEQTRALMVCRLTSLAQGMSGVRLELLQLIVDMINLNILPRIPQEGSVGASGDLTPLSYLAACLIGEREVLYQGEIRPSAEVLAACGLSTLKLRPKEGLALMNGTAAMTGVACLAFDRADYLSQLATRITALSSVALLGNANHFDKTLFSVKPHPGQNLVAARIRGDLHAEPLPRNANRLQDRYSIRCAPHIIGVLVDSLPWMRQFIENELNSANDNPIIDGVGEHVMHGGHFYGGHIAFAMDALKNTVANLADLLDRQMALLMDVKFNHGLPANLSGAEGERRAINHGFKAVQIGTSAWAAEALKNTMPASVFSRSTECHNQDKVSMGTIAARDCIRVLELTEQVAAAVFIAANQGVELRRRQGDIVDEHIEPGLWQSKKQLEQVFEFLVEDRPLESNLREIVSLIQQQHFDLYAAS